MDELTADDVRAIRAALTWGDTYLAKQKVKGEGDDVDSERSAFAMHRAAIRLGLVAKDSTLQTFLDAVPIDAMNDAMEERRDPTSPSTAT